VKSDPETNLVPFIPKFILRSISHRHNLVKIVENTGWLLFDRILRMGIGLVVVIWMARYLGPVNFGLLNFVVALNGLFMAISMLGMKEIVVRDVVVDPDEAWLTLGTTAMLQLIGGVIAYSALLTTIYVMRPEDVLARSLAVILGAVLMLKFCETVAYWFEAQVQSKYTVWVQNGAFLLFALIKILLILQQAPLIAFAWAMLLEAVLVAILLLIMMGLKGIPLTRIKVSMTRARTLLMDSWPLIISAIAVTLYMKIDQIMLGQIVSEEAVGIYSAAVRISEIWYFIPMAIAASVFPAFLETKKRNENLYNARLQKLFDLMVFISVSLALPMTFLATPIVELLYGASYVGSGSVLALHIWASVFVFLGVASSQWFVAENRQILQMQRTVLGAIVNVSLNFWLIPIYGTTGAAVATVISYAVATLFADLLARETRHLFVMKVSSLSFVQIIKRGAYLL